MQTGLAANAELERLSVDHAAEAADLLNRTWPALYGETGCPVFSETYLQWLYGGPNQDRHLILGRRVDGALVGLKAYLHRRISDGAQHWDAHISTHLTIDPDLDFGARIALASTFAALHPMEPDEPFRAVAPGDLSFAYFEADKPLARSTKSRAKSKSIQGEELVFNQAVVAPHKALKAAGETEGVTTRRTTEADMPALLAQIRAQRASLWMEPDPATLWRHISAAPGALALTAERDGAPVGFIAAYRLDWVKDAQKTSTVVTELIVGDDAGTLATLLARALEHAKAQEARGVVLDNAGYLDEDAARAAGVLPTPKRMFAVIRGVQPPPSLQGGFLIDVK